MQAQKSTSECPAPSCTDVLNKYVELACGGDIKQHLMSNSVVDWFGRSIRGAAKISEFFKHEVATQYEHTANLFQKPEECAPIEQRPVHMSTKRVPTRDIDHINPRNKVNVSSLKPYAESDIESDDEAHTDIIQMVPGNKTPERADDDEIIAPLTPPASKSKPYCDGSITESDDDNEDDFMEVRAKRMKRSHPTTTSSMASSISCLRRLAPIQKGTSRNQLYGNADSFASLDDTSSAEEEEDGDYKEATAKSEYSHLRYMEVMCMMRKRANTEESKASATNNIADNVDNDDDVTGTSCWDRPVQISISYRIRFSDQQLFFALIIYNHTDCKMKQTQPLRRNLLTEFSQAVANEMPSDAEGDSETVDVERLSAAIETPVTTETVLPALDIIPSSEAINTSMEVLRTPTKFTHTPPATPKRKPRTHLAAMSGMKRLHVSPSPSTPKRSAARSLRL